MSVDEHKNTESEWSICGKRCDFKFWPYWGVVAVSDCWDLPQHDAICHSFKQGSGVGVDGQHVLAVWIFLQRRVDVVGEGKALLLWKSSACGYWWTADSSVQVRDWSSLTRDRMLSSFTGDLAGAPDGHDSLFLIESFPETFSHLVIFQVLEYLISAQTNRVTAILINTGSNEHLKYHRHDTSSQLALTSRMTTPIPWRDDIWNKWLTG